MTYSPEANNAAALYVGPPKVYNCAQAVAEAFERNDLLEPLKACGGGRANGGLCGALHAALLLVPEDKRDTVKEQFRNAAGEILCRPIRQEGKTPCAECVRIAADIVAKMGR